MKERFVNFFKRDSTLKVVSVVAAIIIWFIVLSDNNPKVISTRSASYSFRQGQVSVNYGDGIIKNIHDINGEITVKISGRNQSVANTTESDFNVDFDFSAVNKPGLVEIPVRVTTNKVGIKIDSYSPKVIKMSFEKIIDKSFNVKVEVDSNVLKDGYEIYQTNVVPESIPIEGFESAINKVSSVKVIITLSDVNGEPVDRNITVRKICKYYDKNGRELNEFEKNNVDVTLIVGKKVPIKYQVTGKPREGYYIVNSSISPSYALITGEPQILDSINSLTTDTVDVSNAYNDIREKVKINLPSGVSLLNPGLAPEVNVRIKPFEKKTVNIRNTDISLKGGNDNLYNYKIADGTFTYQFTGKEDDVNGINVNTLKPQVDVSGLGTGTHILPINITVPNGVVMEGSHYVTVEITEKTAAQTPSETTQNPGPTPTASPNESQGQESQPG